MTVAPWSGLTSVERIREIHAQGLLDFGGPEGPARPEGCIESALGAAQNAELYMQGQRHMRAGLLMAAYLLVYLARDHCFTDGNKRVGWATAVDILAALGLGVDATDDEAIALMKGVMDKSIADGRSVAKWLAPRLFALP